MEYECEIYSNCIYLLFFNVIVKRCGFGVVNGVLYSHGGYLQTQL